MSASATLPFHAMSLYSPVPKQKGVTNLAPTEHVMSHMFDEPAMLKRMNVNTRNAATTFMNSMNSFSSKVKARTFDSKGLSQGMPFVLDVNIIIIQGNT
ncbi:hypothetical protein KCU78_g66, partial [Aureobasidium melanogenum]